MKIKTNFRGTEEILDISNIPIDTAFKEIVSTFGVVLTEKERIEKMVNRKDLKVSLVHP